MSELSCLAKHTHTVANYTKVPCAGVIGLSSWKGDMSAGLLLAVYGVGALITSAAVFAVSAKVGRVLTAALAGVLWPVVLVGAVQAGLIYLLLSRRRRARRAAWSRTTCSATPDARIPCQRNCDGVEGGDIRGGANRESEAGAGP